MLAEATVALAIARLVVVAIPFRRVAPRLGTAESEAPTGGSPQELRRVGWAVHAAGSRLPWRCKCLEQSFAAKLMLRRRKIPHTLYLGVRRGDDGVEAHAWVLSGEISVTGGRGTGFAVVARFADLRS